MAWLEKRHKTYHIRFLHDGRHHSRSLKTGNERKAKAAKARLEEDLLDVERGRLDVPPGADLVAFLLSDDKVTQRVVIEKQLTLGELFERYKQEMPEGAKEGSTRYTEVLAVGAGPVAGAVGAEPEVLGSNLMRRGLGSATQVAA